MRPCRVGLLFPTQNADTDDYLELVSRTGAALELEVLDLPWPEPCSPLERMSTDELIEALRSLGSASHLREVVPDVVTDREIDVIAFAVTSSSFLDGVTAARDQQRTLQNLTGRPATSTTIGYLDAVTRLALRRVAVASDYPPEFTDRFVACLHDVGAAVVARVDADARSDGELAAWPAERIIELTRAAAHPEAEAVLLPETALHTAALSSELEAAAGVPVITATQATLWSALRELGTEDTLTAQSWGVLASSSSGPAER